MLAVWQNLLKKLSNFMFLIINRNKRKAFTLVEILVVIVIIGFLATVVFTLIGSSTTAQARDTNRVSNLHQLQTVLERYSSEDGSYPVSSVDYKVAGIDWGATWTGYGQLPQDPLPDQDYAYVSDGTSYELFVKFETDAIPPALDCSGSCGPGGAYNAKMVSLSDGDSGGGGGTPWACGDGVTFTYRGSQVTYGTVESLGECWLDRDLGSSQVATTYNDSSAYGDLFQWGRLDDNHQDRSSATTTELSGADAPGHGNFIVAGSWVDWRSPGNDNLWQGVLGINNPCPDDWRVPTSSEWETEMDSWSPQTAVGAFASPLKLTVAGERSDSTGEISFGPGTTLLGQYWSSSALTGAPVAYSLGTAVDTSTMEGNVYINMGGRSLGQPIRCIKD
jgi:uncharacterized protein (TIGR02145 family)/prepilin-type N-terminal cleavage/methylation domain-containing protein